MYYFLLILPWIFPQGTMIIVVNEKFEDEYTWRTLMSIETFRSLPWTG